MPASARRGDMSLLGVGDLGSGLAPSQLCPAPQGTECGVSSRGVTGLGQPLRSRDVCLESCGVLGLLSLDLTPWAVSCRLLWQGSVTGSGTRRVAWGGRQSLWLHFPPQRPRHPALTSVPSRIGPSGCSSHPGTLPSRTAGAGWPALSARRRCSDCLLCLPAGQTLVGCCARTRF